MSNRFAFYYALVGVGNTKEGNASKQRLLEYWTNIQNDPNKKDIDLKDINPKDINSNEIHRKILEEFRKAVKRLVSINDVGALKEALEKAPKIHYGSNFSQTLAGLTTLIYICDREMYRFLVEYGFRVDVEGMVLRNVRAGKPQNVSFLEWFFSLYIAGKPDDPAIVTVLKVFGRMAKQTSELSGEMITFLKKFRCAVSGCENPCYPTASYHVAFNQWGLSLHTNDPNICKQPDHLGACFELCSGHFFERGFTISESGEIAEMSEKLRQMQEKKKTAESKKREAEREISVVEQEIRTHQQQQKIARVIPQTK